MPCRSLHSHTAPHNIERQLQLSKERSLYNMKPTMGRCECMEDT